MGSRCCNPIHADSKTVNVPDNTFDLDQIYIPTKLNLIIKQESVDKFDFSTRSNFTRNMTKRKSLQTATFNFNVMDKLLDASNEKKKITRRVTMLKMISKETTIEVKEETLIEVDVPTIQLKFINELMNKLGLFKMFDNEIIEELIQGFFRIQVNKKELYTIGDDANIFYIIENGCIELSTDKGLIYLTDGHYFGIESIEEHQIRKESARVVEPSVLFCLCGELYRNAKEYMNLKILNDKIHNLKLLPLIKNLDQKMLNSLSQIIEKKVYQKNTRLVTEGDIKDRIYLIHEGTVIAIKNNRKIKNIENGEYFGEINLITKLTSFYTYLVESDTVIIYELPYNEIKRVLGENYIKIMIYQVFNTAIKKSERINEYLFDNVNDIFNIFSLKFYESEEIVFSNFNNKNKKICIILTGRLRKQGKPDIIAKNGELYGELIAYSKTNLEYNIVSDDLTLVLEAEWVDILKSFPSKRNIQNLYDTVSSMKKIPVFSTLSEIKLFHLAKRMTIETFTNSEEIIREGTQEDKFYIIKTGKVKVYQKGRYIREMENGSCFGEISLFPGIKRTVTILSQGKTECFVLSKDSFNDIVDLALLKQLQKILSLQDIDITLENLYYLKVLGNRKFGKVLLAHNQKGFYAIKYANIKSLCSRGNLMKNYINEKNIMMQLDHPFITKLVKTIKDNDNIFFILEYIDGVPLRSYIDKRKKSDLKNTYETGFYGLILLSAINYLHNKRIIHRNIKPDNCMIDSNGYLKLIDFGIAKMLQDKDHTNTRCGSPHYSAPEVILGNGYSYSADYWSIGILMFEIFYGYLPFGTNSRDTMDIYNEIIHKNLILTNDSKFNDANNFFKIILTKNLIQRVCNFNLLRTHPFFHQFDYDQLTDFEIKPPFYCESFIEQNLTGGISLFSHTNIPLNNYMENNEYYDEEVNEKDELFEKEMAWIDHF